MHLSYPLRGGWEISWAVMESFTCGNRTICPTVECQKQMFNCSKAFEKRCICPTLLGKFLSAETKVLDISDKAYLWFRRLKMNGFL